MNIQKQIDYWSESASEDLEVARDLVEQGRPRHGLFFAHLALEKILKAHVCKKTGGFAPKIHRLVRLAQTAEIKAGEDYLKVLAHMNLYQLEGRYHIRFDPPLSPESGKMIFKECTEVFEWLRSQL
jgi:HEPN domain-containing protein